MPLCADGAVGVVDHAQDTSSSLLDSNGRHAAHLSLPLPGKSGRLPRFDQLLPLVLCLLPLYVLDQSLDQLGLKVFRRGGAFDIDAPGRREQFGGPHAASMNNLGFESRRGHTV